MSSERKRNYEPLEKFMRAVRFAQRPSKFKTEIYFRQHHMDIIKIIFNRKNSHFMMMSWHGNAFRITGPLWGEWTDHPHKGIMIRSFDVFSLLAWTNYLTNNKVTIDQISVSLCEGTALVTCESPSQTDIAEFWCFLCCLPQHNVEQAVKFFRNLKSKLTGRAPFNGEFLSKKASNAEAWLFFVSLNKLLNKQLNCWIF